MDYQKNVYTFYNIKAFEEECQSLIKKDRFDEKYISKLKESKIGQNKLKLLIDYFESKEKKIQIPIPAIKKILDRGYPNFDAIVKYGYLLTLEGFPQETLIRWACRSGGQNYIFWTFTHIKLLRQYKLVNHMAYFVSKDPNKEQWQCLLNDVPCLVHKHPPEKLITTLSNKNGIKIIKSLKNEHVFENDSHLNSAFTGEKIVSYREVGRKTKIDDVDHSKKNENNTHFIPKKVKATPPYSFVIKVLAFIAESYHDKLKLLPPVQAFATSDVTALVKKLEKFLQNDDVLYRLENQLPLDQVSLEDIASFLPLLTIIPCSIRSQCLEEKLYNAITAEIYCGICQEVLTDLMLSTENLSDSAISETNPSDLTSEMAFFQETKPELDSEKKLSPVRNIKFFEYDSYQSFVDVFSVQKNNFSPK